MTAQRVLVTGGSRSGKSAFAEDLAARQSRERGGEVLYLATGHAADRGADPDWADRVARHQRRRPASWSTVETHDVVAQLNGGTAARSVLLIDGIGTWLAGQMDRLGVWAERPRSRADLDDATADLVDAFAGASGPVIAVTDEVGSSIVPETSAGRLFRDELGQLNVALARAADEVWLVTVGIGQRLR